MLHCPVFAHNEACGELAVFKVDIELGGVEHSGRERQHIVAGTLCLDHHVARVDAGCGVGGGDAEVFALVGSNSVALGERRGEALGNLYGCDAQGRSAAVVEGVVLGDRLREHAEGLLGARGHGALVVAHVGHGRVGHWLNPCAVLRGATHVFIHVVAVALGILGIGQFYRQLIVGELCAGSQGLRDGHGGHYRVGIVVHAQGVALVARGKVDVARVGNGHLELHAEVAVGVNVLIARARAAIEHIDHLRQLQGTLLGDECRVGLEVVDPHIAGIDADAGAVLTRNVDFHIVGCRQLGQGDCNSRALGQSAVAALFHAIEGYGAVVGCLLYINRRFPLDVGRHKQVGRFAARPPFAHIGLVRDLERSAAVAAVGAAVGVGGVVAVVALAVKVVVGDVIPPFCYREAVGAG